MNCTVSEYEKTSEYCTACNNQICRKYPIIEHILFSGDSRKIKGLNDVMSKYGQEVRNYRFD